MNQKPDASSHPEVVFPRSISEGTTIHEAPPSEKPVLYLPNGTALVKRKPPIGFDR